MGQSDKRVEDAEKRILFIAQCIFTTLAPAKTLLYAETYLRDNNSFPFLYFSTSSPKVVLLSH